MKCAAGQEISTSVRLAACRLEVPVGLQLG